MTGPLSITAESLAEEALAKGIGKVHGLLAKHLLVMSAQESRGS